MPRKKTTKAKDEEIEEIQELENEPIGTDDEEDELDDFSAIQEARTSLSSLDHNDLFATFDPDEEDDIEAEMNDPRITRLDDPPLVGGSGRSSNMFGNRATTPSGRAISPKLYSQAAQFPSCIQLRVWKYENGVPVGLGAISAEAAEEDLVQEFYGAMPKKGEGRCQFKLRPIDINGNEMGTEINLIISEHHAAIQRIKRMEIEEDEEPSRRRYDEEDDLRYQPQWDRMMGMGEKRAEILERQLEEERDALRRREEQRMQEQVDLATASAQGVQVLSERMMAEGDKRAERAMRMQSEQSQTLVTTLTSIFSQQQSMLNAQSEAQRRADEYRLEQERQRAQRERAEAEERRHRERLELEERRQREREEYERKMRAEREYTERKLQREQKEMELRLQRERSEMQMKTQREKDEREARERWFSEERARKDQQAREDARIRELDRQRQHERMMRELEVQQQKDREHAERMVSLSRQELQTKSMGGLGEMLPMATGFLTKMGLEPADVISKIFAPEPEPTSAWSDTLPKLLGAGADIAKAALSGGAGMPVSPIHAAPQALPQLENYDQFDEMDYREELQRMKQPAYAAPEQPFVPEQPSEMPREYQPPPEGGVVSFKDTKLVQDTPPQNEPLPQTINLSMSDQREARNGMATLVRNLHASPQGEWEGMITQSLMATPVIYEYSQAVSVKAAIEETGADPTLTVNILNALKASPLVPNTTNFGA